MLNCFWQATFLDDGFSIEHARKHGHTHLYEVEEVLILVLILHLLLITILSSFNSADYKKC